MQQRPGKDAGSVFDASWFRYYDLDDQRILVDGAEVDEDGLFWFVTCDPARTISEKSDYTVVGLFALDTDADPPRLFVVDWIRQKLETPDLSPLLEGVYRDNPDRFRKFTSRASISISIATAPDLPVEQLKPTTNKWIRSQPAAAWMKSGRVLFPRGVEWLEALRTELLEFDSGAHDDQVDVIAYAVKKAQEFEMIRRAIWEIGGFARRSSFSRVERRSRSRQVETIVRSTSILRRQLFWSW